MVTHDSLLALFLLIAIPVSIMTSPANAQSNHADSKLSASISKTEKQWGQYLHATLRYQGPMSLKDIDLSPWRERVAITVDDEIIDEDENGNTIQILKLRLHPRKPGKYQLSSLSLGVELTQAIDVDIKTASVEGAEIKLDWQVSTRTPWQREAVILRVQLQTMDYAAHVKPGTPSNLQYQLRALKTERHALADGGYRFDAGWILHPTKAGTLILDLPPVRYRLSGSDRRQFYLPLQKLQVKALPNYLPPTLPVGKINVRSQLSTTDKKWQLFIDTDALISHGIPDLDIQLAAISQQEMTNIGIKHSRLSSYSEYGDRSLYSSPVPNWLMPYGRDLKLSLRYFDPESGRLQVITHNLPRYWNMPAWAWWVFVFIILLLAVFLVRCLRPQIQTQISKRILQRSLRNATDVKQLRKLILCSGPYFVLSEWAKMNKARKPAIDELNYYCFSVSKHPDIQRLKTDLINHA